MSPSIASISQSRSIRYVNRFPLNFVYLPLSEVSISSLTSRTLMLSRSHFSDTFPHLSFAPALSVCLCLSLSCGTCVLSPPKNYAMSGSVLYRFFSDLLLLFPTTIDLCAPPHEPIYHGAACTVRYISHPYPSAMKYCGALSLLHSLSLSRSPAVSLAHLMAPPPGTINSTPDIIVVVGPHNGKSRYKIYSPPGPIDIIMATWTR